MRRKITKKQKWMLIVAAGLAVMLTGCGKAELLQESVILEAGESLSEEITDYASFSSDAMREKASLDFSGVDTMTVGTYEAYVVADSKTLPFSVEVVDTTAPVVTIQKRYPVSFTQQDAISIDTYEIQAEDASECVTGFGEVRLVRTEAEFQDSFQALMEELRSGAKENVAWEEMCLTDSEGYEEQADISLLTDSITLAEDGQYEVEIVTSDIYGNAVVHVATVIKDTKAPDVETENATITAEEFYDSEAMQEIILSSVKVQDALFGDITGYESIEVTDMYANVENNKFMVYYTFDVSDYASNSVEAKLEIHVSEMPFVIISPVSPGYASGGNTASGSGASGSISSGTASTREAEAKEVAQQIADDIMAAGYSTDLEKITAAAIAVYGYQDGATYTMSGDVYATAYGVFIAREYSCAGETRALGMILDLMGYTWHHVNENQYDHQWCVVENVDGQEAWADGDIGEAGYGQHWVLSQ